MVFTKQKKEELPVGNVTNVSSSTDTLPEPNFTNIALSTLKDEATGKWYTVQVKFDPVLKLGGPVVFLETEPFKDAASDKFKMLAVELNLV